MPNPLGRSLVDVTRGHRTFFAERYPATTEWLERVVYFASNAGGDPYVWDPRELAQSQNQECPVYCLRRHEEDQPEFWADSFFKSVRVVLERVREWRTEEPDEEIPENSFSPYYLRMKESPTLSEIQLWLAWNNTARDLALSIRDHGRTDAFPILADALQEAGCTNADLLDSCRTGDPDIDGAWVLQVLLGKS